LFAVVTGKGNGGLSPWGREDGVHGGGRGWRRIAPTGLVVVDGSGTDQDSAREQLQGAARSGAVRHRGSQSVVGRAAASDDVTGEWE
jgi:hypothetical protein